MHPLTLSRRKVFIHWHFDCHLAHTICGWLKFDKYNMHLPTRLADIQYSQNVSIFTADGHPMYIIYLSTEMTTGKIYSPTWLTDIHYKQYVINDMVEWRSTHTVCIHGYVLLTAVTHNMYPLTRLTDFNTWCFVGCSKKFPKFASRSDCWRSAWSPQSWAWLVWWRPKPCWSTTSPSRTTRSASTPPSAWACARATPWTPRWGPSSRCRSARLAGVQISSKNSVSHFSSDLSLYFLLLVTIVTKRTTVRI